MGILLINLVHTAFYMYIAIFSSFYASLPILRTEQHKGTNGNEIANKLVNRAVEWLGSLDKLRVALCVALVIEFSTTLRQGKATLCAC